MINYVQEYFDRNFNKIRNCPILLYGNGVTTKRIIENIKGYNFVAIVAQDNIGTHMCGLPIISLEKAFELGSHMIIAASIASTWIIYNRIVAKLPKGFNLYDRWGHELSLSIINNNSLIEIGDIKNAIDNHDVISFDIFDTLVMRSVLYPQDILEIVDRKLKDRGIYVHDFKNVRFSARKYGKTLCEIYKYIAKVQNVEESKIEYIKKVEIETELEYVRPRQSVVGALKYAASVNKRIYLTSDMYLPSDVIKEILDKCGIRDYDRLIVSCEYKGKKSDGYLFELIKRENPDKRILHIGDNDYSDLTMALATGIDPFYIYRGLDLLKLSKLGKLIDDAKKLDDRIFLGYIVAVVFNDPFVKRITDDGRFIFDSIDNIAIMCTMPIAMHFMQYIIKKVKEEKHSVVLFCARDGYFLSLLYKKIKNLGIQLPDFRYFLVSRTAAIRAATNNVEDILVFCSNMPEDVLLNKILDDKFMLEYRKEFDLTVACAKKCYGNEKLVRMISERLNEVLENTKEHKICYQKYIDKERINNYEKAFVVDLQTQGTTYYALSRILKIPVSLLACFGKNVPNSFIKNESDASFLYGREVSNNPFTIWYYILEMAFSSNDGMFLSFDKNGDSIFMKKTQYDGALISGIQNKMTLGIEDYPDKCWFYRLFTEELIVDMLDLLHPSMSVITDAVMEKFNCYVDAVKEDTKGNILKKRRGGV